MVSFFDSLGRISSSPIAREEDIFTRIQAHDTFVEGCSFSPDGKLLATCSGDETLKLWDVERCSHVSTLRGHKGAVWNCDFNSKTTFICSCSSDKTVRVWNVSQQKEIISMDKHENTVWACKFCPGSSKTIASCSSDRKIIIWHYTRNVVLRIFDEHLNVVEDICFSPLDYSVFASCSRDKTIRIWKNYRSPCAGKSLVLQGHKKRVTSCAFSPISDEILASCSADLTARVWNIKQGTQLNVMHGHSNIIWKCAFVVYREYFLLATCSSDRSFRVWDLVSECELKKLTNLDSALDPRAQILHFAFSTNKADSTSHLAVSSYEGSLFIAKLGDFLDDIIDREK